MARSRITDELRAAWDATEPADDEPDEPTARDKTRAKGPGKNHQAKDRFGVLNAFVDFTAATLTRGELLVWLVLYRDTKDGTAATSQADIARRAGLGKRTVQLATNRLEAAGLLKRVHRGGLRKGVSRYRLLGLSTEGRKAQ
ncbi:MAG: helix-turn-helix domain-containing protein [Pirellulaceae bacterium]|nr:helix-turn-helix domain-containing protein [Pirellulaceae bacterium]